MSLKDDLRTDVEEHPPWQVCGVRWVMDDIDPADGIALHAAIQDRRVSAPTIERAVRVNLGKTLPASTVRRHRNDGCRCPR